MTPTRTHQKYSSKLTMTRPSISSRRRHIKGRTKPKETQSVDKIGTEKFIDRKEKIPVSNISFSRPTKNLVDFVMSQRNER